MRRPFTKSWPCHVGLALVVVASCRSKDSQDANARMEKARANAGGPVDWAKTCRDLETDLPLVNQPLVANIGGKDVELAASGANNRLVLRGPDIKIEIPAAGIGTKEVLVEQPMRGGRVSGRLDKQGTAPVAKRLRLVLDPMEAGQVSGMISLCLGPGESSWVVGNITARMPEHLSDAPDVTRDDRSTLMYLAERALGRGDKPEPKRFRHLGVRIQPQIGRGYVHIRDLQGGAVHNVVLAKRDGRWTVVTKLPGDVVVQGHEQWPRQDGRDEAIAVVSRAVEARVREAWKGRTFRARVRARFEQGKGEVEVTLTQDAPPDVKPPKPATLTYRASVKKAASGWTAEEPVPVRAG